MAAANLYDLDATEARRLIGERKISSLSLVEACIARIEAVNPKINAVVTKAYERARAEAKAADEAVLNGQPLGILHGLPIVIKDLNKTEGIRTTYCSPLFENYVPDQDDTVIARLRRNGAIILGKTNAPEFACGSNTTNRVFGPSGNPFDPSLTPGGSSGGAGSALATNMVPLANGSDSGASIRNPAAFCGVVGLRPTPGLVSSAERSFSLSTNGVEGPMGRTVADVALLLAGMAEHDSRDMMSRPIDPSIYLTLGHVDVSTLRVGLSEDLGFAPVDKVVREKFRSKVDKIRGAFAVCEDSKINMQGAEEAYMGVRALYLLAGHGAKYAAKDSNLSPELAWNIESALKMTPMQYATAHVEQTRLYQVVQAAFDEYDILITPAVNVLPFPWSTPFPTTLDDRPARHYAEWFSITYAVSLVGHPTIALPAGLDPQETRRAKPDVEKLLAGPDMADAKSSALGKD
ncbi:hypothetical protein LTR78_001102 [Recurvomyces mirabilis]|uniref:Amidase domain-containing protein n=1 Tax=Recurvomyces mirabilis TaxID=574656 RepID=A0AAE1C663_9PEZI|nr:hypothetical protein LTR78_001102 [Recurvomyces mirabilis]KAK5159074.1 hypothetical protein LTS14_003182 [Recurvomyces mirabilis]